METLADDLHFDIINPLTPTYYPNDVNRRPDILDIALLKGVALKFSCIETLQCLNSDQRPVLMRLGSLTGDCPPTVKTITNWQKVSTALEAIDTPILNKIPNDIVSTDDIDNAIGALTNHIRTVVDGSSRTVPANSDRKELPRDVKELIRAKNAALRRASKYPHVRIGPKRAPSNVKRVEEEVRRRVSLPPKDDLDPITQDEVSKHIKALKIRKAPGVDSISTWKEAVVIGIPKPGKPRDRPASYRPISLLSILGKLFEKTLKTRLSEHLIGSTLSPLLYSAYVNDIPRPKTGVQLALFADDTALFLRSNCLRNILPRLQRAIDELTQWLQLWRIVVNPEKPVMTYASPVFAHARPDILYDLQVVQNNFCRRAADAPWYLKNSTLHRDFELPTISKFMKDASERFFDIASNNPNPLLVEAVTYEPPPPNHFCRRPRNVLIDPPDDLTIEVEKLLELNKMVTD
ncbi:Probable RNA-directed DNA polymerase from transposon X-element [Eumeta japonica]|uniref:Probable RNA-directed DNA polymerase from transposon X-element n=1 Tax=Eumeta variegata TaxID=151549 RepID=A0A4C1VCG8_EUMVA|nr:Probable RNA-directed DNA polymerase from transposon X-element [Eumeta japonica]